MPRINPPAIESEGEPDEDAEFGGNGRDKYRRVTSDILFRFLEKSI